MYGSFKFIGIPVPKHYFNYQILNHFCIFFINLFFNPLGFSILRKQNLKSNSLLTVRLLMCGFIGFAIPNTFTNANSGIKEKEFKNFYLTDTQNIKHTLSSYKGKWVIVNYWATWCPPCLEEVPDLVALYDGRKNKDVMVLGVVFNYESADEITRYVDDMLMSYPIILGDELAIKQIGSADAMPTTFIYNPKGLLVKVKRGLVTKSYLKEIMAGVKIIEGK